ncbi:DUF3618 domain-containing protein [Nonomuraea pusilla]|uniref:DUF3618 domain-containing protein n=1 Tax=Nonomuraea pusilla TaxID=46177 RepID=A0A1H7KW50_9ACTN|nr:DUF3618 domain-containing protein [Nonomuraea pusilla]SEK90187.1 Protein of unknown function [Nonomuraea pusilla]
MSETNPGYSDQHAGDVGARRATVGMPTEHESINVPPTRPGAAENARQAEAAREGHETFIPESPVRDDRVEAIHSRWPEEESLGAEPSSGVAHDRGPRGEPLHGERARGERGGGERARYGAGYEEDDVRRDIERTRRELGDTVGQLAHKADVKARAGEAASHMRERAGNVAVAARERAGGAAVAAKERAAGVAERVRHAAPEQVRGRKKRPLLLLAAAGAAAALAVQRARTRGTTKGYAMRSGMRGVMPAGLLMGRGPVRRGVFGRRGLMGARMTRGRGLSGFMGTGLLGGGLMRRRGLLRSATLRPGPLRPAPWGSRLMRGGMTRRGMLRGGMTRGGMLRGGMLRGGMLPAGMRRSRLMPSGIRAGIFGRRGIMGIGTRRGRGLMGTGLLGGGMMRRSGLRRRLTGALPVGGPSTVGLGRRGAMTVPRDLVRRYAPGQKHGLRRGLLGR